jgi:hypothetical protein
MQVACVAQPRVVLGRRVGNLARIGWGMLSGYGRLMLQALPCGAVQNRRMACKSRRIVGMQFRLFDSCDGWVSNARKRLLVQEEKCSGCMLSDSLYVLEISQRTRQRWLHVVMLDVCRGSLDYHNGVNIKRNGRYGAHSMTDRKHGLAILTRVQFRGVRRVNFPMRNSRKTLLLGVRNLDDVEGTETMFPTWRPCPAEAHEHCDTHCNLPLQGLDADDCYTATTGFLRRQEGGNGAEL